MAFAGVGLSWATERRLAGEFCGDQSERDKEINQELADLRCDDVVDSLKLLQVTLPNSSKQREQVRALLKAYE